METLKTTFAKYKFPYVDKLWLSNTQINQKLSNHFWHNDKVPNTQFEITQTLKFDMPIIWATIGKIYCGPSHTKIPTLHYATKTNETWGLTYYLHASTYT